MQINAVLLSAASATGSGVTVAHGGEYAFLAAGTFGGSTVGLEVLGPDGATWIDISDDGGPIALISAGAVYVAIPSGVYRATISGGSGVSMSAELRSIR